MKGKTGDGERTAQGAKPTGSMSGPSVWTHRSKAGTYWYPVPGLLARHVEQLREWLGTDALQTGQLAMVLLLENASEWYAAGKVPAAVVSAWEERTGTPFPALSLPAERDAGKGE